MATTDDGSSIRIKVAQYCVDQKLQEIKKLQIDTGPADLPYLQRLPQIYDDPDNPQADTVQADISLPPLYPSRPDHRVSWDQLKKHLIPPDSTVIPPGPLEVIYPPWYRVAIIGAGLAGLRTAMLLQERGIPYKIFEASSRPGGRIFTYEFLSTPEEQGKHDYYDVGAMRFPDNKANEETFKLFKELKLESKLNDYVLSTDNNIRYFNNIKTTAAVAKTAGDHFRDEIVPQEYLNKKYRDPWKRDLEGVSACTSEAFDPFRQALLTDFNKGWEKLMKYDWASTRSYLTVKGLKDAEDPKPPEYPLSVVHWMETRNSGTGYYDEAFSDVVLSSLEFDDPTKKVEWKCLEGGSKVLVDAMLATLDTEPSYNQRVTSIEQEYLLPHVCFPNDTYDWPTHLRFPLMNVKVPGKPDEFFTHVVSTVSFAELGLIDTTNVTMTYKQRQAIRTLRYGPAVKVAIRFKTRWWEDPKINQQGGSSTTDRPSREIVYPSYGKGESGPGVLMVTYNRQQDGLRFGALIQNPDWSEKLDPKRKRPWSEQMLLDQIYSDLAVIHGVDEKKLRDDTLDYHPFDWYHSPYTMGAFAHFAPGQYETFFPDIVQSAGYGRFHFAGEVASHHHAWVSGALDSAVRVVREILRLDFPVWRDKCGLSKVFRDENAAEEQFVRGLFCKELEDAELILAEQSAK